MYQFMEKIKKCPINLSECAMSTGSGCSLFKFDDLKRFSDSEYVFDCEKEKKKLRTKRVKHVYLTRKITNLSRKSKESSQKSNQIKEG